MIRRLRRWFRRPPARPGRHALGPAVQAAEHQAAQQRIRAALHRPRGPEWQAEATTLLPVVTPGEQMRRAGVIRPQGGAR